MPYDDFTALAADFTAGPIAIPTGVPSTITAQLYISTLPNGNTFVPIPDAAVTLVSPLGPIVARTVFGGTTTSINSACRPSSFTCL